MNDMKDKILDWFAHGECGVSSEAMACAVAGMAPKKRWAAFGNHPCDPDDFKRCIKFLDAVPEARQHLGEVAKISTTWAGLIAHWDELEALFRAEYPTGKAPKLYERMKELKC